MTRETLIPTEEVRFMAKRVAYDDRGAASTEWEDLGSARCAVEPLSASADGLLHPDGARTSVKIHVPSSFGVRLRGCRAVVRGEFYDIEGDPLPLTRSPLPFDRAAEAVRSDG